MFTVRLSRYCFGLLVVFSLVFSGCLDSKDDTRVIEARLVNKYFTPEDSVYLGTVGDFKFIHDRFLISEFENSRLLVFHEDFTLDTIVGRFGQGPGEFRMAGPVGEAFGHIYVHDIAHGKIRFYTPDFESFSDFSMPNPEEVNSFVFSDSVVYYSSTDGLGAPIVSVSFKDNSTRRFGSFVKEGMDEFQKINRSQGYIFRLDNHFIYILATEPRAMVYDEDFNVVSTLDWSHLEILKNSLARAKLTYLNDRNTTVYLIDDVYNLGNDFYLSAYEDLKTNDSDKNYGFKRKLNKVIRLTYDASAFQLQFEEIIDLSQGGGWYGQILITKDHRLFANDGVNDQIHEFALE
jgi:hypothetical protein